MQSVGGGSAITEMEITFFRSQGLARSSREVEGDRKTDKINKEPKAETGQAHFLQNGPRPDTKGFLARLSRKPDLEHLRYGRRAAEENTREKNPDPKGTLADPSSTKTGSGAEGARRTWAAISSGDTT